jgi:cholesterol transport system auxiliary component
MKTKTLRVIFIGNMVLIFLLIGCVNVDRLYPEKQFFVLNASRNEKPSPSKSDAVLKIQRFRVSSRFESNSFVYRRGDLSYESDFYNEFLISPAVMITEEVNKWLAQSGLFQQVMSFSGLIEPTFYLEGVVSALYGDYRSNHSPEAVLEVQFFLVRNVSARPVVVFEKTYRQEAALKEKSPVALAEGWSRSLEYILSQFEANLKTCELKGGETY